MAELPEGFKDWTRAQKIAYYKSPEIQARLLERDKAKEINPLAFYKPLPGQKLFHSSEARNRLLLGGNRAGKSEGGCNEDLYWLLGSSPYRKVPKGPLVGVISGLSLSLVEMTLLEKLKEYAPKGAIKIRFSKAQGGGTIEGPNGVAYFKSNESGWQAFQGMALDFAHLDEEHSVEVFRQIRKRLKRGRKLNIWCTMTAEPDKPDHWTYDELYLPSQDPANAADFAHFALDLNDNRVSRGGYLADTEVDYIINTTPVDDRPAVIEGKYVKRGGLVYPSWGRENHVIEERSLKSYLDATRQGIYTAFGFMDWGVRNPTAMGLILEDKDGNCHLIDEIYRPARDILDIKREYHSRWGGFQCSFIVADPSIWHNIESQDVLRTIAGQLQYDDYGNRLPGLPLIKGINTVDDGLMAVRELLRVDPKCGPKLRVQPRCLNFIKEIENYVGEEWMSRTGDRNKKEDPRKQNDHAMDGFRYFAMSPHGHDGFHNTIDRSPYVMDEGGFMRIAG